MKTKLFSLDFVAFFIRILSILCFVVLLVFFSLKIGSLVSLAQDHSTLPGADYMISNLAKHSHYILRYFAIFDFPVMGSSYSAINRDASFYHLMVLDMMIPLVRYVLQMAICVLLFFFADNAIKNKIKVKSNAIIFLVIAILFLCIPLSQVIFEYHIFLGLQAIVKKEVGTFVLNFSALYLFGGLVLLVIAYLLYPFKKSVDYIKYGLFYASIAIALVLVVTIFKQIQVISLASKVDDKITYYNLHSKHNPYYFLYLHRFNVFYSSYLNIPSSAELKGFYVIQTLPDLITSLVLLFSVALFTVGLVKLFAKKVKALVYITLASVIALLTPFFFMLCDYLVYKKFWSCLSSSSTSISYRNLKAFQVVLPFNYDYVFLLCFGLILVVTAYQLVIKKEDK